jgi:hypothetical protein
VVVAVLHAVYEIAIHTVLHSDIDRLGESVEALQKSVDIEKGAVKSGLEAVFSSRDEVNKAIGEEIQGIPPNGKLRVLGISMGALLCPHGALHGTFRELLARKDVTIEVLILDIESVEAVKRAQLEEPREFAWMPEGGEPRYFFETTRCHNELKTATDFVQDIAERCFFREKSARDQLPKEIQKKLLDAPNEPQVNAHFSYRVYDAAPLCYLVIFEDCLFLENYHNAGRGGESPVLKVVHFRGHSSEPTSLFQIYESHFNVMYQQSKDKTKDKRQERMSRFEKPETNSATN